MCLGNAEPTEVKFQHEAIEDDPFSRKVIKNGLLYFESKVVAVDQTGELIEYVIKIRGPDTLIHGGLGSEKAPLLRKCFVSLWEGYTSLSQSSSSH